MTDALLSRLRELAEKATPAPWDVGHRHPGCEANGYTPRRIGPGFDPIAWNGIVGPGPEYPTVCENFNGDDYPGIQKPADAELIVALRNAWPSLLSRLEAGEALAEAVVEIENEAGSHTVGEPLEASGFGRIWLKTRAALAAYAAAKKGAPDV